MKTISSKNIIKSHVYLYQFERILSGRMRSHWFSASDKEVENKKYIRFFINPDDKHYIEWDLRKIGSITCKLMWVRKNTVRTENGWIYWVRWEKPK